MGASSSSKSRRSVKELAPMGRSYKGVAWGRYNRCTSHRTGAASCPPRPNPSFPN